MASAQWPPADFGKDFGADLGAGSTPEGPRSSLLLARLTLSAIERAGDDPSLWRQPELHHALLVSGLSLLVGGVRQLQADLG